LYKDTPPWFLPEIRNILARKLQTPANVTLRFQLSKEAAEENMRTLQKYNNNLSALIENNAGSIVSYGSEFRPVSHLEFLLMHHVNWLPLVKMLTRGFVRQLTSIDESDRLQKNEEFIVRGNHKSANKYLAILKDTLDKEANQGWMIPVPLHFINKIPDAELAPVGIDDKQFKLLPDGSKLTKYRLTHDQSFEASVGASVNKRVIREDLEPLYYGGCLSRIIHYILSIRSRHPTVKILGGKSDIKSAYRRITLNGKTAVKCAIMCQDLGLLSLRLTFGGSPCPNEWCIASELCTDLANDILHCKEWNPAELHSPHAPKLPTPQYLSDHIPFAPAAHLDVTIPEDDMGRIDDFIDDGIAIVPDLNDNKNRAVQALLLAIHILFRPVDRKFSVRIACRWTN
jgi:hypothetical protein